MIGFEQGDGPAPAVVTAGGTALGTAGREPPPTEACEVVPLVEAPHFERRPSRLKRQSCPKDVPLAEVVAVAAHLFAVLEDYCEANPCRDCPCPHCVLAEESGEFFAGMRHLVKAIGDRAETHLPEHVRKAAAERTTLLLTGFAIRREVAEGTQAVRTLARCQGVPDFIRDAICGATYRLDESWAG